MARDLGTEILSGLKGFDLKWNAQKWREGTCWVHLQKKDRASSRGLGLSSHSKNLSQNCSCLKELQRQKWRRTWGKGGSSDWPKLEPISRGDSKAWHYYWCYGVLTDKSLAWLSSKRPNKQLTETSKYLHSTNGLKSGIPVVELRKGWKKLRRRSTS